MGSPIDGRKPNLPRTLLCVTESSIELRALETTPPELDLLAAPSERNDRNTILVEREIPRIVTDVDLSDCQAVTLRERLELLQALVAERTIRLRVEAQEELFLSL